MWVGAAARAPGLRARLGLRSPRVPSSFARPELPCSRRPERRGRAVLGGPGGGRPSSSRGRARHRHSAEPPGGFPAPRPGRPNNLALCSPRAPPPRLCSGFGARPPAAAQTPPGPTRHPGSVSPTCAGLPRPELYAQVGVRPGVKCEDLGPEHVAGGDRGSHVLGSKGPRLSGPQRECTFPGSPRTTAASGGFSDSCKKALRSRGY